MKAAITARLAFSRFVEVKCGLAGSSGMNFGNFIKSSSETTVSSLDVDPLGNLDSNSSDPAN